MHVYQCPICTEHGAPYPVVCSAPAPMCPICQPVRMVVVRAANPAEIEAAK